MIVLSVGMPRAGSGWYYNLTNDLMLANGAQDARRIRQRYHLQRLLTEVNCNIGALTPRRLIAVMTPSLMGNTFVIKAHAGPTHLALRFIRSGFIRPTYIFRDPRDAMLSALENGERARQNGRNNAFSHLVDFETSINFISDYVRISDAWMQCQSALHTRYEELLTDYDAEVKRLAEFLGVDMETQNSKVVVEKYRPESAQTDQKGIHFSKGKIGRFRQNMSPEQQERMVHTFGAYLERMDYPL